MDRTVILWIIALNVLAGGVLYSRFSDTKLGSQLNVQIQALYSTFFPERSQNQTCGLLHWEHYAIVSNRVVLPSGIQPATIHVSNGRIQKIDSDASITGTHVLHFKDLVVSPGVIDVHVHFNEPGRVEWEGMASGTAAAAMGGITTAVDMPLNSNPVTTTLTQLLEKQKIAKVKAAVNMGFWAGLVPENAKDHSVLQKLVSHGALGFKSFMCPSGINDFANVEAKDIAAALPFFKKAGVPFFVHAEVVSEVEPGEGEPSQYDTYLASRPPKFERDAVELLISVMDNDTTPAGPGFSVHIAHLSDAGCLPMIEAAQKRGHPLTVETCAHYLAFSKEQIKDGQTFFKCAPPIRDSINHAQLLQAVKEGKISLVSSDHSPAPPELKQVDTGDFMRAWGGISGVQYLLPATWTALREVGVDLAGLSRLLSEEPAKLAGLQASKGKLAEGYDADIIVWDPEADADTSDKGNLHRHKLSPYTNMTLKGKVSATIVKGHVVQMFGGMSKQRCGSVVSRP